MKRILALSALCLPMALIASVPDSLYVRPTGLPKGGGLVLEVSADGQQWTARPKNSILSSDYGAWGSGKKMYTPSMAQSPDGLIAVVFAVSDRVNQFGVCHTRDFIRWRPQDYPYMKGVEQCLEPVVQYADGAFKVTFHDKEGKYYQTTSADLIHFSDPVQVAQGAGNEALRLPRRLLQAVEDNQLAFENKAQKIGELAKDDATRFNGLNSVKADIKVNAAQPKAISDKLLGIFFEDINYAADGGLNADLVQNGDFEYTPVAHGWNQMYAWTTKGKITVNTEQQGISQNNGKAVALKVAADDLGAALVNGGWDGISAKKGAKLDLSLYIKGGKVKVSLVDGDKTLASATVSGAKQWKKQKATLTPSAACSKGQLVIEPLTTDEVALDMVSLMPQDTYKGHGLRKDLAETLEALHPKFMRFPGGCVAHGNGLDNMYHWKETIGPLEDRKPAANLWGYHQSRRIGYYEFFQMCEDMGMEPLPVVSAGVPCQNSSWGGKAGQQGGIPMEDMPAYVQDVLDLIEWANGDATTTWGKKRIEQGHKKPFNLKMIGIGNEDLISPTFEERYLMICRAVKERYPDIEICGTVGPFYYGSDYDEGWDIANRNADIIDMVDEHYYVSPGWYIYNQDFYDSYDRQAPKVYLGEWAAHGPGRKSTIETALCEAMHICGLERNGDVVVMSSYAPLLAKEGHTQWSPDMIYFNNEEVHPTVGYYMHRMCGQSQGNEYLPSTIKAIPQEGGLKAGVQERLAVSAVRDTQTGKTYIKIVNVLPCQVEADVNLEGVVDAEKQCTSVVLTGAFDSTTAVPAEGSVTLAPQCKLTLPAYSFTLIEV